MTKHGYRDKMRGFDARRIERIVEDYVLSDRDKKIVKLNLLHGVSYTEIPDHLDLWVSTRTVQNAMNRWMPVILEHLEK